MATAILVTVLVYTRLLGPELDHTAPWVPPTG